MTLKQIQEKANHITGIGGMTVNERLYSSGLMNIFDQALKDDKDLAEKILTSLKIDKESIKKII